MSTRPLADVQEHLTEICAGVAKSCEPVIIERKDQPSVILAPTSSDRVAQRIARVMGNSEYVGEIREAASRVQSGEVITMELEELKAMFKTDADRS